ncbi:MAG: protoporphyrinogen oxidase HemJ [Alphaproteobacteria bacterium]
MSADLYPWIKALHIIAVIAWMAGLLYLPRLFVYHCEAEPGSARARMLEAMERRLLRAIMTPALVASFVFGGWLLLTPGVVDWSEGWIHMKLVLVLALATLHGMMAGWRRDFAAGRNAHGQRFYRIANEVPTLLMIAIVVLVVVKPF